MSSTYEQIGASAAHAEQVAGSARTKRAALGAVASALFAAAGTAAWLSAGHGSRLRHQPLQASEFDVVDEYGASQCGKLEPGVEYVFDQAGAWGTNYDHIPTAEMCCAMCQGNKQCQAFTWVKDAGLAGNPSQCWLKGGVGTPTQKMGVVSGVPPPTPMLPTIPSGIGGAGGTMYCFALMMPTGYEPDLVRWQYEHQAGIFGCDRPAVFSNQNVTIAPGFFTDIVDSDLKCGYGGDSQSALNSWIFIAVWKAVTDLGVYRQYEWTIKADPDTVFFPDRMSTMLASHKGASFINNCQYGLHGPIEVFSSGAIDTLAADYQASFDGKAPGSCVKGLHFGQWGEDMFIAQCLEKVLSIQPVLDASIMCEGHCDCGDYYWCKGPQASFHPFKTIDQYATCVANAIGSAAAPAAQAAAPAAYGAAAPAAYAAPAAA